MMSGTRIEHKNQIKKGHFECIDQAYFLGEDKIVLDKLIMECFAYMN